MGRAAAAVRGGGHCEAGLIARGAGSLKATHGPMFAPGCPPLNLPPDARRPPGTHNNPGREGPGRALALGAPERKGGRLILPP